MESHDLYNTIRQVYERKRLNPRKQPDLSLDTLALLKGVTISELQEQLNPLVVSGKVIIVAPPPSRSHSSQNRPTPPRVLLAD